MKCRDCKYCQISNFKFKDKLYTNAFCSLSHYVVKPDMNHRCGCFNKDLSEDNICYNCRYYMGGGDWGLFCSHKEMYHHLGNFNDKPCKYYTKKRED